MHSTRLFLTLFISLVSYQTLSGAQDSGDQQVFSEAVAAIHKQDLAKLDEFLAQVPTLADIKDEQGKTLMHYAADSMPRLQAAPDDNIIAALGSVAILFLLGLISKKVPTFLGKIAAIVSAYGLALYVKNNFQEPQDHSSDTRILSRLAAKMSSCPGLDAQDKTPLDYALEKKSLEAIELLHAFKCNDLFHSLKKPLSEHFTIYGNTAPDQSRIVFLGEIHENLELILLNLKAIATLAQPGDVILFESGNVLDGNLNITTKLEPQLERSLTPLILNKDEISLLESIISQSSSSLPDRAYSWEDGTISPVIVAFLSLVMSAILIPAYFSCKTIIAAPVAVAGLFYALSKLNLSSAVFELARDGFYYVDVTRRNDHMMDVINMMDRNLPAHNKIFVIAGSVHLPYCKENEHIAQYIQPLKEFLAVKKHAVLFNKKLLKA